MQSLRTTGERPCLGVDSKAIDLEDPLGEDTTPRAASSISARTHPPSSVTTPGLSTSKSVRAANRRRSVCRVSKAVCQTHGIPGEKNVKRCSVYSLFSGGGHPLRTSPDVLEHGILLVVVRRRANVAVLE